MTLFILQVQLYSSYPEHIGNNLDRARGDTPKKSGEGASPWVETAAHALSQA